MLPYEIIFTFFFHLWFNVRVIVCFNVRHFMLAEVVSVSQVLSEKHKILSSDNLNNFFIFFWPSILLVLCCHSFVSYPPQRPMTSHFQGLSSQILSIPFFHTHHNGQWLLTSKDSHPRFYPLLFLSYHTSWERASVKVKVTTGTIFIMSLVWPPALKASTLWLPVSYQRRQFLTMVQAKHVLTLSWKSQTWFNTM